jgi:hypothetical protein
MLAEDSSIEPGGGVGSAFAAGAPGVDAGFAPGLLSGLQAEDRRSAEVTRSRGRRFIGFISKGAGVETTGADI